MFCDHFVSLPVSPHLFLAKIWNRSPLKPDASWILPVLHPSLNLPWSEEPIGARKRSTRSRRRRRIPGRGGAFWIPPSPQNSPRALRQHESALMRTEDAKSWLEGLGGGPGSHDRGKRFVSCVVKVTKAVCLIIYHLHTFASAVLNNVYNLWSSNWGSVYCIKYG